MCSHVRGRPGTWIGSHRSTPRSCACISTTKPSRGPRGALQNYKKFGHEPPDHAIGCSRGGLTTKNHLVCDGRGRALAFILTPGQAADTSMLAATLEQIRVRAAAQAPGPSDGRQGLPVPGEPPWLRERGIAATIPNVMIRSPHRRKRRGRPIDFGDEQQHRYRDRYVGERCFNKLKQWRGIAMRSDKLARNYHAGLCLAATLHWLTSGISNTPQPTQMPPIRATVPSPWDEGRRVDASS